MKVSGVILQEVIKSFVTGLRVGWMPVNNQVRESMVKRNSGSFNKLVI